MTSNDTTTRTSEAGMTFNEVLATLSIGLLLLAGFVKVCGFAAQKFPSISNRIASTAQGTRALDAITRDIRHADLLSHCSSNSLVFRMRDLDTGAHVTVSYSFDPKSLSLTRTTGNKSDVLLKRCARARFNLLQRNPALAHGAELVSFPVHPSMANRFDLVKAVDITWVSPRSSLGAFNNTEEVQSARVVIRKG